MSVLVSLLVSGDNAMRHSGQFAVCLISPKAAGAALERHAGAKIASGLLWHDFKSNLGGQPAALLGHRL